MRCIDNLVAAMRLSQPAGCIQLLDSCIPPNTLLTVNYSAV